MKMEMNDSILKAIAGSYQPSFLQIQLTHSFDGGFGSFNLNQIGTFVHEYIHFLQNVSTPWGLYMSMVQYQELADTFSFIQKSSVEIELPLHVQSDGLDKKRAIVRHSNGLYPFSECNIHLCNQIDKNKKININRSNISVGNYNLQNISLDVSFVDGSNRRIDLGAYIINESMAAMYQKMIDPDATHDNFDLPYNLVQILCEQHYPNIANDKKKLISICYISLFSLSPAVVLLEQLEYASTNPDLSGEELFFLFIKESKIKDNKGNETPVEVFMDQLIDKFIGIIKLVLNTELDYIEFILNEVRISAHKIPLLAILHNDDFSPYLFESMVNALGLPFTYNLDGHYFMPKSRKDGEKESEDMLKLIQFWAIFSYISRPNDYRCCPLKFMCMKSDPIIDKEECFDFPWEGKPCPITSLTDYLGLSKKSFSWKK